MEGGLMAGRLKKQRLSEFSWDDRCACYWAAYQKLSKEDKENVDQMVCELRDRVKGENFHIQLSEAMALAIVGEACVRKLLKNADAVVEEVRE
jgi:hypothetical protein